jgi:hypothetical protein
MRQNGAGREPFAGGRHTHFRRERDDAAEPIGGPRTGRSPRFYKRHGSGKIAMSRELYVMPDELRFSFMSIDQVTKGFAQHHQRVC